PRRSRRYLNVLWICNENRPGRSAGATPVDRVCRRHKTSDKPEGAPTCRKRGGILFPAASSCQEFLGVFGIYTLASGTDSGAPGPSGSTAGFTRGVATPPSLEGGRPRPPRQSPGAQGRAPSGPPPTPRPKGGGA